MLQSMRDGAQSKVIKAFFFGLLIMAGLGLIMSDIGGFFRNSTAPTVAFEVDGEPYSVMELDRRVSQILQMQGLTLEQGVKTGIIDEIINTEIDSRILRKEGFGLGIRVSDAIVAEDTRTLIDSVLGAYGSGVTRENIFMNFLRNLGMSEQQYVVAKKSEITADLLTDALTKTNSTPEIIGKFLNAYENEKRIATTYLVKADNIPAPTDDQLRDFYEETKENYRKPEYRQFSVALIKYDDIRDSIDVSNEELKEEYEANIDSFTTPEVRTISQARFDDEETANKVYEAAQKENDIKKAVIAVTGKESDFIPSSDFMKRQLPADLGEASFNAKVGEVSAPVKTDLGWFVMKVEKSTPAKAQALSEVSEELKKDIRNTRANNEIYKLANQFEDGVSADTPLKELAKELGVPVVSYDYTTSRGSMKDTRVFSGDLNALKTAFELYEGEVSHMLEDNNGNISFVYVDKIEESFIPEFDTLKSQIERDFLRTQKLKSSRDKAIALIADIEDGKTADGFKTHAAVSRDGSTDGLDSVAVATLFQIEKQGDYTTIPQGTDHLVIGLKDIKMELKDGNNETKSALDFEFRNDLMAQYFATLRQEYSVKKDKNIVEKVFGARLEAQQ